MIFMTPARTLSNDIPKGRLIGVNTKGEEDMIFAKFEGGAAENFGRFLRNNQRLNI